MNNPKQNKKTRWASVTGLVGGVILTVYSIDNSNADVLYTAPNVQPTGSPLGIMAVSASIYAPGETPPTTWFWQLAKYPDDGWSYTGGGSVNASAGWIPVTGQLDNLGDNIEYQVRLTDGSTYGPSTVFLLPGEDGVKPVPGHWGVAGPVFGTVLVTKPGRRWSFKLKSGQVIPVQSKIDSRKGRFWLLTSDGVGMFQGGPFVFRQIRSKGPVESWLTDLKLQTISRPCARIRSDDVTHSEHNWVIQTASGSNFNISGKYGTASGLGLSSQWSITNDCKGILIKVEQGAVDFLDKRQRTIRRVETGQSYRAARP